MDGVQRWPPEEEEMRPCGEAWRWQPEEENSPATMRLQPPPASAARHHASMSSGSAEGDGTELADNVLPFPPEGFCSIKYLQT
uniref:Uncharacterized protein n=1 Tax=Oryza rufipogon TaxID=4529 RepID=A0A679BBL5_ORYRU|nr:hypothetical protein [Oryza rufipogon]